MKSRLLLLLFLFTLLGCQRQQRPADLPPLYPVELTLMQENKPVPGADVLLSPVENKGKWAPGGTTDATGMVRVKVSGKYEGAPIGPYNVCVTKSEIEGPSQLDERLPRVRQKTYYLVEEKYASPETTPLQIEVSKGKNIRTLDVGKAIRVLIKDEY